MSPCCPIVCWRALLWTDGILPPLFHLTNPELLNGTNFKQCSNDFGSKNGVETK